MKRFTETSKWDDPWFRKLPPRLKCFWQYLCDRCDHGGAINPDFELASFQIGERVSDADLAAFDGRVEKLPCGKWWILKFVPFQFGTLSQDCKAHGPIFAALTSHGLLDRVCNGIARGSNTPKERDKEEDKEKDKEQEKDKSADKSKSRCEESEAVAFCRELGLPDSDGSYFFNKCVGNGWTNGGKPIKDWKATIRSWKSVGYMPSQKRNGSAVIVKTGGAAMRPGEGPIAVDVDSLPDYQP